MGIVPIIMLGDPVLRQKSKKVTRFDSSLQALIDDLIETMRANHGVGLAAPQVGELRRVIAIETPDEGLFVLVNPEVVRAVGERTVEEGCLSIPGYRGIVKRAELVTVKGRDRNGKPVRIKADELLAQALEHEIDHLNGVLYIDRIESPDQLYKIQPEEEGEVAEVAGSTAG